jgi:hypothetical protein
MAKKQARQKILQAVNLYKLRRWANSNYQPRLVGPKQIQQAVFIARQNNLVKSDIYIAAGFNG